GLLYVGDSKMGAIQTRRFIHEKGDYYLVPLSATQVPESVLSSYLMEREQTAQELTGVYRDLDSVEPTKIAEAFEIKVNPTIEVEGKEITWKERHLVVRSIKIAEAAQKSLKERVQQAQVELVQLNQPRKGKKRLTQLSDYQNEAERIIEKYQVEGLLKVEYVVERKSRQKRAYQGQPAQIIKEDLVTLSVQVDEVALTQKLNSCSWRVYATNSPSEQLSVTDGVMAYRDEYLVEKGFSRLKGFPLSLTPMYLQREDHITGLIRLLSIGLRLLTLLEFEMRRSLSQNDEKISGIYPGNPKRKTARPSSELLLAAFKEITLVSVEVAVGRNRHLTKFSPVHHQILRGLNIPLKIYTNLTEHEGPLPSSSGAPSLIVPHLRE
ncbi:MAG: IS1634 family transposase, partial [Planktothrix sp.]